MLNKPLSRTETEKPVASPHSPEVQKLIQSNAVKRSVRHLSNSMGVLEGGMQS
ncbi:hypothetical protein HZA44_01215, partial [Candidatus Peregrinibacteria bacterium]|nr:hypothetical protein [Candidatus Peregrinibacteria bacterium]